MSQIMPAIQVFDPATERKLDREVKQFYVNYCKQFDCEYEEKDMRFWILFDYKIILTLFIQTGISYQMFELIKDSTPFPDQYWSELLELSSKTLQRYRNQHVHFKPTQSEKILEMAEVTSMGVEVFGDMETFKRWLTTPSYALGNHQPQALLKDSYGKALVMGELNRINHGILS